MPVKRNQNKNVLGPPKACKLDVIAAYWLTVPLPELGYVLWELLFCWRNMGVPLMGSLWNSQIGHPPMQEKAG
jgi:hypothetical protein